MSLEESLAQSRLAIIYCGSCLFTFSYLLDNEVFEVKELRFL